MRPVRQLDTRRLQYAQSDLYYSCNTSTNSWLHASGTDRQVSNPVALFATDNKVSS